MTIQPIQLTPIDDVQALAPAASCCGGSACGVASTPAQGSSGQRELLVEGMTCEHCVRAVTDELTALDGVDGVEVDLVVGGASRVRIDASQPVGDDALREAVVEAGYRLV